MMASSVQSLNGIFNMPLTNWWTLQPNLTHIFYLSSAKFKVAHQQGTKGFDEKAELDLCEAHAVNERPTTNLNIPVPTWGEQKFRIHIQNRLCCTSWLASCILWPQTGKHILPSRKPGINWIDFCCSSSQPARCQRRCRKQCVFVWKYWLQCIHSTTYRLFKKRILSRKVL